MSQSNDKIPTSRPASSAVRRHPIYTAIAIAILVFVGAGFLFFGPNIGNGIAQTSISFGSYASREINDAEGSYFMNRASQYAQQQNFDSNPYALATVLLQAFNDTVLHYAFLSKAETLGFTVSDRQVLKSLTQYPAFQDARGNFDLDKLTKRSDYAQILKDTKESLIQETIRADYTSTALSSTAEKDFITSTYSKRRVLSAVEFTDKDYPNSELITFAKANEELFKQASLSTITVASKETADALRKQLVEKTATFEDLAKANSLDSAKDKGGLLDTSYLYLLKQRSSEEAYKVYSNLKTGELSEVLVDGGNFIIAKANADLVLPVYEDAAFLEVVRSYISERERGKLEDYLSTLAKDFASKAGTDLVAYASQTGRTIRKTQPLAINSAKTGSINAFTIQSMYGPYSLLPEAQFEDDDKGSLGEYSAREDFYNVSFGLKKGQISEPLVAGGKALLLTLTEETVADATDTSILTAYLDSIIAQLKTSDIKKIIVEEKKLNNKFTEGFSKWTSRSSN